MIWLVFSLMFAWMVVTTYTLNRIEKLVIKSRLDQPSMFTEQLNRRLIEEHTAELRRFNQSHKKGSAS